MLPEKTAVPPPPAPKRVPAEGNVGSCPASQPSHHPSFLGNQPVWVCCGHLQQEGEPAPWVIRNPQHRGSQSPFWSLSLPIVPFFESSCAYCMSPCFKKPDLEHNGWGLLLGKCFFLYIKTQEEALLLQQRDPDTLTEGSFILNKAHLTLKT